MTKILMVCLGNICRSPLAEGILKSKLPINQFIIDSAGTGNYHVGDPPDLRSIKVAKKYGVNISNQKGRQFSETDFDTFDYIYVMDDSNYENVIKLARNEQDIQKVRMILNEIYPKQNYNVPDPYTGGIQGFESTFKMLDEACEEIAKKLLK
ncbi:low molecular weight protein-tyrosine-phosphatase [Xanthomarina sp. F2636L]|uniref:low molecular weight protein-tyrosine-phosphatase n=1 Tax=Xanthomarina sp. F2636L TaxID=2996018 RepID=UPI00225DF635|nr:low molecular weight protein-tyrosine-phosphatase [Xanthomarina sp. F2636L]MCX7552209.1 low molecular weight phosphotyrosine protein phosphatase [Xanthomarina sp. F2636L]